MSGLPEQDLAHVLEHVDFRELKDARLFLTGGTGFVGKWLLESLLFANDRLDLGVKVVVLTRDASRFQLASPHLAAHSAVELLEGNARDFVFPIGGMHWVVIHAATERQFEPTPDQPLSSFDLDIEGTRHVLEFARRVPTHGFLFTSSGAVYGKQPQEMSHIPDDYLGAPATTDPGTAYGQAKRASEWMCATYAGARIARLFAFVGPYLPMDQNFAVGNFIADVLARKTIEVKGDGRSYRSYLYAADLVIWLWTILLRGESGRTYNVGSDRAVTIAELARTVAEVTGGGVPVQIWGRNVAGVAAPRYVPSIERARKELGLRPIITLEEGVRRTYEWARAQQEEEGR
jgi:dTDP-glucose 4,6-dehydratase